MTKEEKLIKLQGHEKFALRDGWLNKGLMQFDRENMSMIFLSREAPDVFGIGSNMVKSLRYWLRAFGLLDDKGSGGARLTEMGQIIKEEDPYLEDIFTLWVLHSFIVKNAKEATTWFLFFQKCDVLEMDKEEILRVVGRELNKYANYPEFSERSLISDVGVLLSMYSGIKSKPDPEDKSISPFGALGLLKISNGNYTKVCPDRRVLGEWNVLYELACLMQGRESISIEEVSVGEGSLSAVYQMNNVLINEYLDKLDAMGYLRVDRTAGLDMIYRVRELEPYGIMREYYKRRY